MKEYYTVTVDQSSRIGSHSAGQESPIDHSSTQRTISSPPNRTSEAHFFGLQFSRHTAASCILSDTTGKALWSPFPPFRFGVELWNLETMDQKTFSHTVWYAGSLFNVYAQVVRKKGVQLGLYLHRQSSIDTIPAPSLPHMMPGSPEHTVSEQRRRMSDEMPSRSDVLLAHESSRAARSTANSPSPPPRFAVPGPSSRTQSPLTSPSRLQIGLAQTPGPVQPFRDPRAAIRAYFGISCFSATGSALTRFSSSPDVFSVGQSWGWKSSSLTTDCIASQSNDSVIGGRAEVSLRGTVILGLV